MSWILSKFLFRSLILPIVLYRTQLCDPDCKKTEYILQEKLNVKNQTPYAILLIKTVCLSLETKALYLAVIYIKKLRSLDVYRVTLQTLHAICTKR